MEQKTLWETLWDYDPNGLVAVDRYLSIRVVNAAFCRMFGLDKETVVGRPAAEVLGDVSMFMAVRASGQPASGWEREFPEQGLFLRHVLFPLAEEDLTACILVDLTSEHQREQELIRMKQEMIANVNQVIDRQMRIAQEIAGLLGESTAEAKVNLIQLRKMLIEDVR
jgi:transcriptional regulator with PAS, ATPase and Fis domain